MPDSTSSFIAQKQFPHHPSYKSNNIHTFSSSSRIPYNPRHNPSLLERISGLNLPTVKHPRYFSKGPDLPKEPGLNVFHFKKFIRLRTLEYNESHACLTIRVPKHLFAASLGEPVLPHDIETPTVFINKKTGNFVVPSHGITGSWPDFEHLINTWFKNRNSKRTEPKLAFPSLKVIDSELPPHVRSMFQSLTPIEGISPQEFKELLKSLKLLIRDFDVKDFVRFGARVNKECTEVYFPVRYTNGNVVGVRKVYLDDNNMVEKHYPEVPRNHILPFPHGLHQTHQLQSTSCILVGSILDSVALSRRLDIPVVTLPDWSNLHPDHLPFLDQFETIFLWFNNDVQGSQNSRLFAQKIEEKRCRLVSSHYPGPVMSVRRKMDIKEILTSARSSYHEFLTTFENLRENVYLEFLQSDELMGVKWKRFDQMNPILGGFRRGELTVFSGRTGSGKTTFLSEYSLDLCMQGVNTLWCSFEVKNTRLLKMMLKQFSLINLDDHLDMFERAADKFSKLPLYLTDFHGSQEIHRVQEAMSHAVYVHDISHIIIDNMQFMLGSANSMDRFQVQDQAIQLFRQFATAHNCHVTLVIHPRKENEDVLTTNSISGGAKATQEADNVLLLQEEDNPNSFFKKKSIQVAKNRYAGDLGTIPLHFTKPILTFSKKMADQYKKQTRRKAKTTLVSQHFGQESTQILTDAGHESTKSKESGGQGLNEDSTFPFEDPS